MSSVFFCAENNESWRVENYNPVADRIETKFVMYREVCGRRELMLLQLTSLASAPGDSGSGLSLCAGSPERDILPVLASGLGVTEVCTMFYIERCGGQVVYR